MLHTKLFWLIETCTPLVGCTIETSIDQEATRELREEKPIGRFIGLEIFSDRGHLAISEVKRVGLAPQISTNFLKSSATCHFTEQWLLLLPLLLSLRRLLSLSGSWLL